MNRRKFLQYTGLFLGAGLTSQAFADTSKSGFDAYKKQQEGAFKDYVTSQKEAFELFEKTYLDAFNDYKENIDNVWDQPEVSTPKKWVSYTEGFQQKTVVDYEQGTVTVSQMIKPGEAQAAVEMAVGLRMATLERLTYQQAYVEDPVAQAVDKTITTKVAPKIVQTIQPSTKPVGIFATRPNPNDMTLTHEKTSKGQVVKAVYKLKTTDVSAKVKEILPNVMQVAAKEKIPPALVLAIIKNESAFNPLARSHIPAYGLMQIVPSSAGKDATAYLFGEAKVLSSSYLYTPDKNMVVGAAYLHILNYRYLKHIENPESRLYCTIAAYNTGSGNVAKAFTGKNSVVKAAPLINQKTPSQVYDHLVARLPYDETKNYLKKVNNSYREYQKLFETQTG